MAKKKKQSSSKRKEPKIDTTGEFVVIHDCECGNEIKHRMKDFSNDPPRVHMVFLGQTEFYCDECDKTWCYGDIEYMERDDL